jgi:DNA repair protein RadA/Sms
MAKVRDVFVCSGCGAVHARWMGKCPDCGAWDSLEKQAVDAAAARDPQRGAVQAWNSPVWSATENDDPHAALSGVAGIAPPVAAPIAEAGGAAPVQRIPSGIGELDRVLGGGLVPGSVVLLGGEPGIGKSTLLLQAAGCLGPRLSRARIRTWPHWPATRVLYVSSEESSRAGAHPAPSRLGAVDRERRPCSSSRTPTSPASSSRRDASSPDASWSSTPSQMVYKSDIPAATRQRQRSFAAASPNSCTSPRPPASPLFSSAT